MTCRHARIAQENELEARRFMGRDTGEQKELQERQRLLRQKLQEHLESAKAGFNSQLNTLYEQLTEYAAMGKEPELKREALRAERKDHAQSISHAATLDYEQ